MWRSSVDLPLDLSITRISFRYPQRCSTVFFINGISLSDYHKMELYAYMQEIKLAGPLGYKEVAEQLFENYRVEREILTAHLK